LLVLFLAGLRPDRSAMVGIPFRAEPAGGDGAVTTFGDDLRRSPRRPPSQG
jgi:hypothetical protein